MTVTGQWGLHKRCMVFRVIREERLDNGDRLVMSMHEL